MLSNQRGSALLITLVVITVVAGAALTAARLAISGLVNTQRSVDSLTALGSAHGGIEDGLLRFRFDRNAQAPTANCQNLPHSKSRFYDRFNLTDNQVTNCINPDQIQAPALASSAYDIKIFHRLAPGQIECVGSNVPQTAYDSSRDNCIEPATNQLALNQDDSISYSIEDLSGSLSLAWEFDSPGVCTSLNCDVVEISSLGCGGTETGICNKQVYERTNPAFCISGICRVDNFDFASSDKKTLRIKTLGTGLRWYTVDSTDDVDDQLDSRFTGLDVIGYYGGVKRRLELSLDRKTGTSLPIYDHVLYSGQGDISSIIDPAPPVEARYFRIGFDNKNETVKAYISDPETIAAAQQQLALAVKDRNLIVNGVLGKTQIFWNEPWSFHWQPDSVRLVENTTEICDADPQWLEQHLNEWNVSNWCPWSSYVAADLGTSPFFIEDLPLQ